jgi:toxin ParE1/3/4
VRSYRLSHEARVDLDSITGYIASSDPGAAERLLARFEARLESLADMPGMGRPREELRHGLRSSRVGVYLIFYFENDDGITIARILHGHRDLPAALETEGEPPRS